jgi:signal transduction protein with GAF and PtsI domain
MVSGIFLITADRQHKLLVAEHGVPPAQHRLRIPLDLGHPGWVVRHQRPLVLANTDEAPDFRQILQMSRMGSALLGPMCWRGQMLGQLITAAQARNTYGPIDLDLLMCFAHLATAVYMAHGGPEWLQALG